MKTLSKAEAAKLVGCKEFHMGELLRKGKIPGATKDPILNSEGEVTKTLRWTIPQKGVETYIANRAMGGNRTGTRKDGRNKFIAWFTPDELTNFIATNPDLPLPQRANKPKVKAKATKLTEVK